MSDLHQLNKKELQYFKSQGVQVPQYDIDAVKTKIVHIGVGNFNRAHQCVYYDDLLNIDPNWGVIGVSIRPQSDTVMREWKEQDNLFSVTVKGTSAEPKTRIIGSLREFLFYKNQQKEIFQALTNPDIALVTMTVTPKGYYQDQDGNLDIENESIQHDIKNPNKPTTILGYLLYGLVERKKQNIKPFTSLCCDNMPESGRVLEKVLVQLAEKATPEYVDYIRNECAFPSAMVDRIVPVTDDSDYEYLQSEYEMIDKKAVKCEEYAQWVIEDKFCNDKPALDKVGVTFTKDVHAFELMKIRLLNGSHTCMSYFSHLMGITTVDGAVQDELVHDLLKNYMDEVTPTIGVVPGVNLDSYKLKLRERFGNAAISDTIARIGRNGFKKIRDFIVEAAHERLEKGQPTKFAALIVASWIKYMTAIDENGQPITTINDPEAYRATPFAQSCLESEDCDPKQIITEVINHETMKYPEFVEAIRQNLISLKTKGAKATLSEALTCCSMD